MGNSVARGEADAPGALVRSDGQWVHSLPVAESDQLGGVGEQNQYT